MWLTWWTRVYGRILLLTLLMLLSGQDPQLSMFLFDVSSPILVLA